MTSRVPESFCLEGSAFPLRSLSADTWEYDGTTWVQRMPATSPPARRFHSLAYDKARARIVLFGGFDGSNLLADTWEYDGTNWVQRTPATSPTARWEHAMAYDELRGQTMLFGGFSYSTLADTWEYDGTNWVQRAPATVPIARHAHALAYNASRARVTLVGGRDVLFASLGDTWEYDGTNWAPAVPATSPPARAEHALAYDALHGRLMLFGGVLSFSGPAIADTWEYVPSPAATSMVVGTGCGNTLSPPTLAASLPILGQTATLAVSNGAPLASGVVVLGNLASPPTLIVPGCEVYLDLATVQPLLSFTTNNQGAWATSIALPPSSISAGLEFDIQAAVIHSNTPIGLDLTNALVLRLGY